MTPSILRALDPGLQRWQWINPSVSAADEIQSLSVEALGDLPLAQAFVDILLPAELFFCSRLNLPASLRGAQRQTALQYALEEEIAGDAEAQHLISWKASQGQHCVAVAHEVMQLVLALQKQHGWRVQRLLPLQALLPLNASAESTSVLCHDEGLLLALDDFHFLSSTTEQWPALAPLVAQQQKLAGVDVLNLGEHAQKVDWQALEVNATKTLNWSDATAQAGSQWNLLQREYSPARKWQQMLRNSLGSAAALVLIGLLAITTLVLNNQQQQKQLDALLDSQQALIAHVAPQAVPVKQPRQWVEQRLQAQGGASQSAEFIRLYQEFLRVIKAEQGYQVQTVQYQNKQLSVSMSMPDVLSFERLRNAVSGVFNASLEAINRNDDGVRGRLVLRLAS